MVVEALAPVRRRYAEITADPETIDGILEEGRERARPAAEATMESVRRAMGLR